MFYMEFIVNDVMLFILVFEDNGVVINFFVFEYWDLNLVILEIDVMKVKEFFDEMVWLEVVG